MKNLIKFSLFILKKRCYLTALTFIGRTFIVGISIITWAIFKYGAFFNMILIVVLFYIYGLIILRSIYSPNGSIVFTAEGIKIKTVNEDISIYWNEVYNVELYYNLSFLRSKSMRRGRFTMLDCSNNWYKHYERINMNGKELYLKITTDQASKRFIQLVEVLNQNVSNLKIYYCEEDLVYHLDE